MGRGPTEALVTHVVTQFQHLLEEAKRDLEETKLDLEVYKKAFSIAERDRRDLEEKLEQEKRAVNDEIRQLRERGVHGREKIFEREKQALNDGIPQLKVRLFSPIRCETIGRSGSPRHKWLLWGAVGNADGFHFRLGNRNSRKTSGFSAKPPTSVR